MNKGQDTRTVILGQALDLVSEVGLEGLTIGSLAQRVDMSKSGLYAHFQSKEELQTQVLVAAAEGFSRDVALPALREPRGRPRVEAIFDRWIEWSASAYSGGCPFIAAAPELDDQPGPVREVLVSYLREAMELIARATRISIDEGHFRPDLEVDGFVFEFWGILLSYHHSARLMRDAQADRIARSAFGRLLKDAQA